MVGNAAVSASSSSLFASSCASLRQLVVIVAPSMMAATPIQTFILAIIVSVLLLMVEPLNSRRMLHFFWRHPVCYNNADCLALVYQSPLFVSETYAEGAADYKVVQGFVNTEALRFSITGIFYLQ